jgi:hypothetical protein
MHFYAHFKDETVPKGYRQADKFAGCCYRRLVFPCESVDSIRWVSKIDGGATGACPVSLIDKIRATAGFFHGNQPMEQEREWASSAFVLGHSELPSDYPVVQDLFYVHYWSSRVADLRDADCYSKAYSPSNKGFDDTPPLRRVAALNPGARRHRSRSFSPGTDPFTIQINDLPTHYISKL